MNAITTELITACESLSSYEKHIKTMTHEYAIDAQSADDMADYIDDLTSFVFLLVLTIKEKYGVEGTVEFDKLAEYFVSKYIIYESA